MEDVIKVPHPTFGYVEFHGMSNRQVDVLQYYMKFADRKIKKAKKIRKNDNNKK